ncbi:response regulator transcription factor [Anaerolineae bacterium CFX7]|nr:response regulator transcription factor [Anaerolineae bacterium CFX7]
MGNWKRTRVWVIDPSLLFYQGVSQVLSATEFQVVTWTHDQESIRTGRLENGIDLALIGHGFGPRDGLTLCHALRAQSEQIKIILLSEHADSALFQQDAFYAGADACVPSSVCHADFIAACHAVAHGAQGWENTSEKSAPPHLTPREIEILRLIARNKHDKEIACELCISVNTVRNHIQNILRKLEVNDRAAAVWRARHYALL